MAMPPADCENRKRYLAERGWLEECKVLPRSLGQENGYETMRRYKYTTHAVLVFDGRNRICRTKECRGASMSKRRAELMYLQYFPTGGDYRNIAILILDREENMLFMRFTENWAGLDDCELEILSALGEDLHAKARELGAAMLVDYLQGALSNALRITDSQSIFVDDLEVELERLATKILKINNNNERVRRPASRSWIAVYHAAAHRWLNVAGKGVRSCQHSGLDLTYAAISAFCILVLLVTSANLFRLDKSSSTSISRASPSAFLDVESLRTDKQSPAILITRELVVSGISAAPRAQKRRRVRAYPEKMETPRALRSFIPPDQNVRVAQLSMMTPTQTIPVPLPTTTEVKFLVGAEGRSLLPLPPDRVRGVRRLLHAMAYPFKKIGAGFAN
jgi:hypothetical protein